MQVPRRRYQLVAVCACFAVMLVTSIAVPYKTWPCQLKHVQQRQSPLYEQYNHGNPTRADIRLAFLRRWRRDKRKQRRPTIFGWISDEAQFRLGSLYRYRRDVQHRIDIALNNFQQKYERTSREMRHDLDSQLIKAQAMQEEYMTKIAAQQQKLADLTKTELRNRKQEISQSLEQFKRSYDETWDKLYNRTSPLGPFTQEDIRKQEIKMEEALAKFRASYRSSQADVRDYFRRIVNFSSDILPKLSVEEDHVRILVSKLREEETLLGRLTKPDLRIEKARFEKAIASLREQQEKMIGKVKEQRKEFDSSLKHLLEQLMDFSTNYDELVTRKESKLYAMGLNDKVLRRVLDCLEQTEADGWEFVVEKNGVQVHRKHMPTIDGRVSKYVCVKATGIINATPDAIVSLFADNSRVPEYNKFYAEGRDLEEIDENTKVVWASSPPLFLFKPRDFCTVVHYRKLKDGTVCVVNRGAEHPAAPQTDKYVRAEILMGSNIIQPVPKDSKKSRFSIVTQVDPGGFAPAVIVNKISTLGPPDFFADIEKAAGKTSGRRGLRSKFGRFRSRRRRRASS